ncbi:MAG: hypothetical protein KAJ73_09550 [Zetaproteobacteria bacterium]|nr:hypothetical protein [Zetaproteobacteria bacterium]
MEAVEFDQSNVLIAEDQEEYLTLPAHRWLGGDPDGEVTTCWRLSILERFHILLTGRIYLKVWTFNKPLQPLKMSASNPLEGD